MELINTNETLFLKQYIGSGKLQSGGKTEKIELFKNPLNGAPIIGFENGDLVVFDWDELVNQAIKFREVQG